MPHRHADSPDDPFARALHARLFGDDLDDDDGEDDDEGDEDELDADEALDDESPDEDDEDDDAPGNAFLSAADGEQGDLDDDFPLGDGSADMSAEVWCPHCGESSEIAVDPGGGAVQHYVEDCPVCCRPWKLTVRYDETGLATVVADADDMDDDE